MSKIFYTSDHHFGHHNIIKYTKRYKVVQTVEEMNNLLAARWNETISENDVVYHLGDVYFKDYACLSKLNGKKKLIVGNHDYKNLKILEKYFEVLQDQIIMDRDNKLVLCHYPILSWPQQYHGYVHLHGHSHGNNENYHPQAVDIGVDCWDYYPVTLGQIHDRIKDRLAKQRIS